MSLLEYDITMKKRVDENVTELNAGNSKKFEVEAIWNSKVYEKESYLNYIPVLYYFVFEKCYLKKKNTLEPYLVVQYFRKLINLFHKNHFDKPTTIYKAINIASLIGRPTIKAAAKPTALKKK